MAGKAKFLERVASLVGRRILSVRYTEIDYPDSRPGWTTWLDGLHTLDHGVELTFDDNSTLLLTWGNEFTCYGLSVVAGSLHDFYGEGPKHWTVTKLWHAYLASPILSAEVAWEPVFQEPGEYPQSLTLRFAHGDVVVAASEALAAEKQFWHGMDNIVVALGEDAIRAYRNSLAPDPLGPRPLP